MSPSTVLPITIISLAQVTAIRQAVQDIYSEGADYFNFALALLQQALGEEPEA